MVYDEVFILDKVYYLYSKTIKQWGTQLYKSYQGLVVHSTVEKQLH